MTYATKLRWGASCIATVCVALSAYGPAAGSAAARPFRLGTNGAEPHIAVDAAGTGHVAWRERTGGDDILRYCRIPRGAGGCVGSTTFVPPGDDFHGPRVLIRPGLLTILDDRCCFPEDRLLAYESTDGGQSFAAPRWIATSPSFSAFGPLSGDGQAIYGPGLNQVSVASSGTGGTYYQAVPTDTGGVTGSYAQVDDDVPGSTADTAAPTVGLFDPLSPVVAYEHLDSDRVLVRAWDGAGAYNDTSNWVPSQPLPGKADGPRIASGISGAYLMYRAGKPLERSYRMRRLSRNGATIGFGTKVPISARGTPIFGDFSEDADGHLHAAWVDNGDPDRLRYSRSANQKSFSDPLRLDKGRDTFFATDLAAAPDGGGWVVWSTDSGPGTIKAAPFGTIGGGGGGGGQPCVPKLTYGKVVVLAREGCLQKDGKRYSTPDPIRINGLDLDPVAGGGAGSSAAPEITIDVGKGTLKSGGKVIARAGNVKLDQDKLGWKLPKGGGEIRDLAGNPATFATGKLNVPLLGLPVSGQTTVTIGGGASARVPVNLELPKPFGGLLGNKVTGEATLRLDNPSGLILDDLHVAADKIWLGIAEVTDFDLAYSSGSNDVFTGKGTILLPVARSKLSTDFGLAGGGFDYGRAKLEFTPPLPVAGQFVLLKSLAFEILTDPTKLAGLVEMTAGPEIPGLNVAAARLTGAVSYTFPDAPASGVFLAQGSGYIADVKTGNVFVRYETPDLLRLGGFVKVPPEGLGGFGGGPYLEGSFDGKLDIGSGNFNIEAGAAAKGIPGFPVGEIGVDALLSNRAIAGCAKLKLKLKTISGGLGYYWGGPLDPFVGCDLTPFRSLAAARTSATGASFEVPDGMPQFGLRIAGAGAPPEVTLTGPGGQTLTSAGDGSPASNEYGAIGPFGGSDDTFALLAEPQKGTWRVQTNPGSAEISQVATADGLSPVRIEARVKKLSGRKRQLTYNARKIAGQRISFYESARGVYSLLGRAKGTGGKGTLRFRAADGPKGRRLIVAAVDSFGAPRERLSVAAYRAPGPVKLGKPKRLRAHRRAGRLALRWRRVRGAKRYVVAARLRDGRRLELTTRKPKLKIGDVPGIDSGRIEVAALKADNSPGKPARVKLRAKPKKRGGKARRARRAGDGR